MKIVKEFGSVEEMKADMIASGTAANIAENKIANIERAMQGDFLIDDGVVLEPLTKEKLAEYRAKQK